MSKKRRRSNFSAAGAPVSNPDQVVVATEDNPGTPQSQTQPRCSWYVTAVLNRSSSRREENHEFTVHLCRSR